MSIYVNVVNQRLTIASSFDNIVSGTQEFVKFKFNLGEEWDGLMAFAQFRQNGTAYNQYLDAENCAFLPAEIGAGTCTLMLYGSGGKTIATTNYLTLKVDDNILISDAQSTEISESLYAQLVDKVNSYTTPTIGDNGNWHIGGIDTGKPSRGANGDKGDAGATGPAGANGVTPHIGNNGNWYIGSTDTGKPSRGEQGQGAELFYIDLDGNYPNYTCPVAMADIKAAYEAGKVLECRCTLGARTATLPLFIPVPEIGQWIFSGSGELADMGFPAQTFTVAVTGFGVQASNAKLATTENKLPNPNALTIKIGSKTVTYDGSSAQTVEIADGTEVEY